MCDFFFFNDTATTEIYTYRHTLSLHDALPILSHSISRFSELRQQPNIAYSHARRDGNVKVIEQFLDSNIGDPGNPAGGIAASAADMANWLITQDRKSTRLNSSH